MNIQSSAIRFTFTIDDALECCRQELRSKGFEEVEITSNIEAVHHALLSKKPGYNPRGTVLPPPLFSGTCKPIERAPAGPERGGPDDR